MHAAMQKMERLVLSRSGARHPGNPAYTWMWSNVVVDKNLAGEMYPRKSGGKDSPNKIDGPVATLTALSRAMLGVVQVAAPTYLYAVFGGKR